MLISLKAAFEREESEACFDSSECEQARASLNKRSTKFEPINPALPVTNIVFILQSSIFNLQFYSVSLKNVSCIDLLLNIIQSLVVAIGNNGIALLLELIEVVHYLRPEECFTIL